ncbi:MAG: dihydroorotate dehydrogenase electron transfer subunit [Oscillospiraceae bacterium]|nr:dihydroorotate dehydrogenase electron transfer subunit [Oscillospiraceae bacterium]
MANVYKCEITENTQLTGEVYSLVFSCEEIAASSYAGQFVHIKCGKERLLRRPISICSVFADCVRVVYEVKGEGTKWLSEQAAGQKLDILGPLGNGFSLPEGKIIIVGGGIGTPPMLYAAKTAHGSVTAILGFRDKSKIILQEEFEKTCDEVIITTDDGSAGIHGFVTQPLEDLLSKGGDNAVLSCGPQIMQDGIIKLCKKYNVPVQVSLEERMACGVGACLVCACEAFDMKRVCVDGPVFEVEMKLP